MKILLGRRRQGFFYKLPALVAEHCRDQFPRRPRRISPRRGKPVIGDDERYGAMPLTH